MSTITAILQRAREAQRAIARADSDARARALTHIALRIASERRVILSANAEDLARNPEVSGPLRDRLLLTPSRLDAVVRAIGEVNDLADPLTEERELYDAPRPNGMRVFKRRIPLGVLAVIYEARPNVTVEAATLAIKSGNAVVLRGGSEAIASNTALARCVRAGLSDAGLPEDAVTLIEDLARERVAELLGAVGLVDLAIPRGGASLMEMVDQCARVPVIRHGRGVCHVYVDAGADLAMAHAIAFNAKVHRPGVCNAMETLLVQRAEAPGLLPALGRAYADAGVELRADPDARRVLEGAEVRAVAATDDDWDQEFLGLTVAIRCVDGLDEALAHIARHGTEHTAAIVSADPARAERFLREVNASCVLWNASTRFNDGGELGLGAEIGISTTRMHAFGPMGLRELTAEKFVVRGDGQTRN